MVKIKTLCGRAKIELSFSDDFTDIIENCFDNSNFLYTLTRTEFENLTRSLLSKTASITKRLVNDSGVKDVEAVVLVGGSSKIPASEIVDDSSKIS